MQLLPHQACRTRRWPLFYFFVLSVLFITFAPQLTAAQGAPGWRVILKEGQTKRVTLDFVNRCKEPHRYRVDTSAKYLRLENSADPILIAPGSTKTVGFIFDATGLKSKVYRGKASYGCADCDKTKCFFPQQTMSFELIVNPAAQPAPYTVSALVSRFEKVVKKVLEKANAKMDDEAKALVDKMIKTGADTIVEQKAFDRLEEAENNLEKFMEQAVEYAKKEDAGKSGSGMSFAAAAGPMWPHVTAGMIKQAQSALCPLYPFCK